MKGKLSITDDSGFKREMMISGPVWLDSQLRNFNFHSQTWEWPSFRFNNGARVHLYNLI